MADYNLHGLNTRDFQHLVQAIARKEISAGITSYGDGKDGARDLSYKGRMNFPTTEDPWDGYLVVGCKFQVKPTSNGKKDADWAIQQLEGDLKKFSSRKRKLQKPDYYLFATNIALTAAAGSGGRDRIEAVLETYKAKLGLKAFGVWDYNDIRGFLDGDRDLRGAYGHFLTAGDVLTFLHAELSLQRTDFMEVMHAFLQKELVSDMAAKLQSAGEDPDTQIPLARVFVDLPFTDNAEAAALGSVERERKERLIVDCMLNAGSSILRRIEGNDSDPTARCRSRFVIVGGPGQGKSTVGQYLCQLYRASFLKDRPRERLDQRVAGIVTQLENQRKQSGGLPLARRFPVRIELRTFAHALAAEPDLTLLEYIRRDFARLGGASVLPEDVKVWFSKYPWIVLLDGLDEVPPSSNRSEVMQEIEHFRIDAASQNSDLLTIATTRPQSYTHEFTRELFDHLYLLPLTAEEALIYGERLAEARCGTDDRRRDELVKSLEKACRNDSTVRLMQSPLQVTIMATLLEETGEPPQQRYRLFAEYYRTIYKRETRRRLLGGILSERQTDIDTVHAQAGLLLHAAAERGGNRTVKGRPDESETALSDDQFRELVRRRLQHIGITDPKATEILRRISDSTLQRLVFLVRQVEGWVRFDVTSFKEFMAAEAVMAEKDAIVRERLETLAPASYWRNVFLFAVGKCFVQREHMLDNIVEICAGLNEEIVSERIIGSETAGKAAKAVLWGSRLALDILNDGTARQFPEYEIRLARVALELLRISDVETSVRLAAVYHDDLAGLFQESISDRLGQTSFWARLGAWHLILSLAERGIAWAIELLDVQWPKEHVFGRAIVSSRERRAIVGWPTRFLLHLATKMPPQWLTRYRHHPHESQLPNPWKSVISFISGDRHNIDIRNRSESRDLIDAFHIIPARVGGEWAEHFSKLNFVDPSWVPFVAGARFGENPSAKALAEELKLIATHWDNFGPIWTSSLPWPIATCIAAANSQADIEHFAAKAEAGELGDVSSWHAAEARWKSRGVTDADMAAMTVTTWPFDANIAEIGFPFALFEGHSSKLWRGIEIRQREPKLWIAKLPDLPTLMRSWLSRLILRTIEHPVYYHESSHPIKVSPQEYRELYSAAAAGGGMGWTCWLDRWLLTARSNGFSAEWLDFLAWLGATYHWFHFGGGSITVPAAVIERFCSDPQKWRGLLSIIAATAVSGQRHQLPAAVLDTARELGPRERIEADIVALASDTTSSKEIDAIARQMSHWSVDRDMWRGLQAGSNASLERGARIALILLQNVGNSSEEASEAGENGRRKLVEYLTRIPSRLDARDVWERLKFPRQLQ